MKVLQLAKFYPPERGGIESIVEELAHGLPARGWPTEVLCAHTRAHSVDERDAQGCRVVRAASLGLLLSTSLSPMLLPWLRRLSRDADLVQVHMPNPMAAAALWASGYRGKLVVHWHSDVVRQQRAMRLYQPLQTWLLRRADAIIGTSPAYAESSVALAPWRHKLHIIGLGISDCRRPPDPQAVAQIRARHAGRRLVFALGRMSAYKGFDVLIDAAAQLPEDVVVLIGGQGELLATHRARVAALGLSDRVHLLGGLPESSLINYLEAADVFCLPSVTRAEAFGVVMLEAMAAGRPVVCSDIPGSGLSWVNVHGQTGLTVTPGSVPALAEALSQILHDPALAARLGAGGRARYLKNFTASDMIDRHAALYRELLAA